MSDEQSHPDQALAEDMATALEQLAGLVRREPQLARNLRWDVSGLHGGVLDVPAREGVLRAAKDLGVSVAAARYTDEGFDRWTLLFGEREVVRMLVANERPPRRPGEERATALVPERVTSL